MMNNDSKQDETNQLANEARREMLLKVGRLSAYAVPASLAILSTSDAGALPPPGSFVG